MDGWAWLFIAILGAVIVKSPNSTDLIQLDSGVGDSVFSGSWRKGALVGLLIGVVLVVLQYERASEFLYFNF